MVTELVPVLVSWYSTRVSAGSVPGVRPGCQAAVVRPRASTVCCEVRPLWSTDLTGTSRVGWKVVVLLQPLALVTLTLVGSTLTDGAYSVLVVAPAASVLPVTRP